MSSFLSSYLNIILDHHHYSHSFFSGLLVFSWLFICFLIHLFRQSRVDKFICLFFDTIIDICIYGRLLLMVLSILRQDDNLLFFSLSLLYHGRSNLRWPIIFIFQRLSYY